MSARFRSSCLVLPSNASRRWLRRSTRPHQPRPVERERNCQVPALPANLHKHVAGTRIFGRQAPDFDRLSLSEWRNHHGRDALGLKGETQFVFEVVIPAHDLLFGPISVDDGFVPDSLLSNAVLSRF